MSFEQLTVAATAVSLASTTVNVNGVAAARCVGVLETAEIRVRVDGTAATASVGQVVPLGTLIDIRGADNVRRFSAIRTGGSSGVLPLTCFPAPADTASTSPLSAQSVSQVSGSFTTSVTAPLGLFTTSTTMGAPGAIATNLGGAAAAVTTQSTLIKTVGSIANAVATDVLTVTIPNAAHSGRVRLTLVGSLGAGGAIGANEASGTVTYDIAITRTAGVATVVTASSAYGSGMANVAGAATITVTAAATAMTGAVGATQTFTVQVTISRGSGSSTNHTCVVVADVVNANATGITIL